MSTEKYASISTPPNLAIPATAGDKRHPNPSRNNRLRAYRRFPCCTA